MLVFTNHMAGWISICHLSSCLQHQLLLKIVGITPAAVLGVEIPVCHHFSDGIDLYKSHPAKLTISNFRLSQLIRPFKT